MKECSVSELSTEFLLDGYLFHQSGTLLHSPGEQLTPNHIALLKACNISTLLFADADADPLAITSELSRKKVPISAIPENEPLPVAMYDASGNCIVNRGDALTELKKATYAAAGHAVFYYDKDPMEQGIFQIDRYKILLGSDMFDSAPNIPDVPVNMTSDTSPTAVNSPENEPIADASDDAIPDDRCFMNPAKLISVNACKEMMQLPDQLIVPVPKYTKPQPLRKIIAGRSRDVAKEQNSRYLGWTTQLTAIFTNLKNNKETDFSDIEAIAGNIVAAYGNDCFYCLNLMNLRHPPTSDRYLPTHSINVAIAATAVGHAIGYQSSLLRELVAGALLHDIGHLLTYRPFFIQKEFGPADQQKYDNHTVVGMAMLKNLTKVPVSTMFVLAQHHEKLDGSGRVFHAPAPKIHDFAKIVAAIDFFETRSRFMTMSAALTSAVVEAQSGKIDIAYIKALIIALSLYPIGVAVKTAKNGICKVIATNEQSFKTPVLRSIYTMTDEHLFPIDKAETIDMTATPVTILEEVAHSALKSDIITGFIT